MIMRSEEGRMRVGVGVEKRREEEEDDADLEDFKQNDKISQMQRD